MSTERELKLAQAMGNWLDANSNGDFATKPEPRLDDDGVWVDDTLVMSYDGQIDLVALARCALKEIESK